MSKRASISGDSRVIQSDGNEVLQHLPEQRKRPSLRHGGRRGRMNKITLHRGMTFHELEQILQQLGFREGLKSDGFQSFREESSGALVILPAYKQEDEVRCHHLTTLAKLLVGKGLVEQVIAVGLQR